MEETYRRTGFLKGISFIFSHFIEYLKLFLMTILNTFIISLVGVIPIVGWIIALVLGLLTTAFVPYGVTSIVCGVSIGFDIYKDFFDFLSVGIKNFIIMQYLKILIVIIVITISLGVFGAMGIFFFLRSGDLATGFGFVFVIIILLLACSLGILKMTTTLQLKIVSSIYQDYDLIFFNDKCSEYRYMFLWMLVPIINLIAAFVIPTIFAIDIKEYFEL